MSAPSYRWICHKCGQANEPDTEACAACDFPAYASAEEIESGKPHPKSEFDLKATKLQKIILILAFLLMLFGANMALRATPFSMNLVGLGLLGIGAGLLKLLGIWFERINKK